jgi:hypothetical protein
MSAEWINRLQVLVTLTGIIPGLITIYGPTWFFFRRFPPQGRTEFLAAHPEKRITIVIYEIASFVMILISPVISLFFITGVAKWMAPFVLFSYMGNSIGIINGIFEVITGICPTHGISFRAYHREYYLLHPDARKAGTIRFLLGIFFIALSVFLFHAPSP